MALIRFESENRAFADNHQLRNKLTGLKKSPSLAQTKEGRVGHENGV